MRPAALEAPLEYLFALTVSVMTVALSFVCDPRSTGWIVFAVGVVMFIGVVAAGARPIRTDGAGR